MRTIYLLALFLIVASFVGSAEAYTCASGCTFEVDYTEPSALTNGQTLTDLASCTLSWTKQVDGGAAVAQTPVVIPASKPAGGGAIKQNITDATAVPGHVYTVQGTVACTSTAFGTSAPSAASNALPMNNGVAPNPTAAPSVK